MKRLTFEQMQIITDRVHDRARATFDPANVPRETRDLTKVPVLRLDEAGRHEAAKTIRTQYPHLVSELSARADWLGEALR